ncbi:MAG: hypothetical protein R3357_03610 [Burkholderiales bacterium]|nr:hypothetical protein [Burkholderiales bacterium]
MTKTLARLFCSCVMLAASVASAGGEIKVLTQNQYLGADLAPLFGATDNDAFNAALVGVLQQVAANRFPERALRQAKEIADRRPDILALQEVWRFACVDAVQPPMHGAGCGDPSIAGAFVDHLQVTLDALQALGITYHAAASVRNFDLAPLAPPGFPGFPFLVNGVPAFLLALDRDVILARDGVATAKVDFTGFDPMICVLPSEDGCNYVTAAPAGTPLGPVPILRGFVGVDATVNGVDYRVVNTHLENRDLVPGDPRARFFQSAQAFELLQALAVTTPAERRLVVLGDMNSAPEDAVVQTPLGDIVPPYLQFAGAGFTDAWTRRPGKVSGVTCCQAANLANHKSALYERIDLIWSRETPAKVKQARVVGADVSDKTPPAGQGIWPSDHGGVVAELQF